MRRETKGVTETLLEMATKEFLKCGFRGASLRKISADSGVSTNSIYTRFGDKAGLFSAIVKPAADGLMDIYLESIRTAESKESISLAMEEGNEGTDRVLEYVYQNLDEFRLIFCQAQGTEYGNYFDRLTEIEESYYKKFAGQFTEKQNQPDDFFIHVYCRMGWQYIYELVTHEKTYEEAKHFMQNVRVFHNAGWNAMAEFLNRTGE